MAIQKLPNCSCLQKKQEYQVVVGKLGYFFSIHEQSYTETPLENRCPLFVQKIAKLLIFLARKMYFRVCFFSHIFFFVWSAKGSKKK